MRKLGTSGTVSLPLSREVNNASLVPRPKVALDASFQVGTARVFAIGVVQDGVVQHHTRVDVCNRAVRVSEIGLEAGNVAVPAWKSQVRRCEALHPHVDLDRRDEERAVR